MPLALTFRSALERDLEPHEVDANFTAIKNLLDQLEPALQLMKVGTIVGTLDNTLVSGWLICNGEEVSRSQYAALWNWASAQSLVNNAANGDDAKPFGYGNQVDTFTLPDWREKVLRGKGDTEDIGQNVASSKVKSHSHTHSLTNGDLTHTHGVITENIGSEGSGTDVVTGILPANPSMALSGAIDSTDINVEQPSTNVYWLIKAS